MVTGNGFETYYFHSRTIKSQITNNIEQQLGNSFLGLFVPQNNKSIVNRILNANKNKTSPFYATATPNRDDTPIGSTSSATDLRMYIIGFSLERNVNLEFSSFEKVSSTTSFGKKNKLAELNRDIKILNKIT